MANIKGPVMPVAIWADTEKYRQEGESFSQKCGRVAGALTDNKEHFDAFFDCLEDQRFLPGGRVQAAAGSLRRVTAFNCFVMQNVPDDLMGMMDVFKDAAKTMQMGGGVGYSFSAVRPNGSLIKSLGSRSSGPLSFMGIPNAVCETIASAGHRRGAQMATMRIDHPDILKFITAKNNHDKLNQFNISVLVTDKFMDAYFNDDDFDLVFQGRVYQTIKARALWDTLMRSTWDWAEPGVIFIDRVNKENNLWYMEELTATNPCGEQPLPPYGACLLGSFNLTRYVYHDINTGWVFNTDQLCKDIPHVVRAMDNVIDETTYPLYQQELEAKSKRRMGLGITGLANTLGVLGIEYGSESAKEFLDALLYQLANECYKASALLSKEKGPFPAYQKTKYLKGEFIKRLDSETRRLIKEHGIRNSHLISIAPTGTISLTANNVSSGIEPVFSHEYERKIQTPDGTIVEKVQDYALWKWGIKCKTSAEVTVDEHVGMLTTAQKWVDSSVSKTCNIGDSIGFEEFKEVYINAYKGGAKGCTTFRAKGKRSGILTANASEDIVEEKNEEIVGACYINPATGERTCDTI